MQLFTNGFILYRLSFLFSSKESCFIFQGKAFFPLLRHALGLLNMRSRGSASCLDVETSR